MSREYATRDLFAAGFAMTRGLRLDRIDVTARNGHHPVATFVFVGDEAAEVETAYETGLAQANVRLLGDAVGFLRKRLFAVLDGRDGR